MRFHRIAEELVSGEARIRMLRVLIPTPPHLATTRELAKLAGVSPQGAVNVLRRLEGYGLVHQKQVGPASGWIVNKHHLLFEPLAQLLGLEQLAQSTLRKAIVEALPTSRIKRVVLFGSIANGEERPSSDIDLLVIVKGEQDLPLVLDKLHELSVRLGQYLGNALSPLVYTETDFQNRAPKDFAQQVQRGILLWPPVEGG